ncbi:MAG: hypothetical protein IKN17_00580 [Ruminococcus sp.]|nr:hypothetical protein [Ruminococcus sp.]
MAETVTALKSGYVRVNCYAGWLAKTMPDGFSYGGNQGWFGREDGYIPPLGCGLISCADVLLYKSGRTKLDRDEYMTFVRELGAKRLKVRRKLGLNGLSMARGIRKLLKERGMRSKVCWCFSKRKMLPRIKEMLNNDTPVTIAAGPQLLFKKKRPSGVSFYVSDGKGGYVLPGWRSGLVKDHYVTVTAVCEYGDRTMLEISSWGERYYIDWAEYTAYINLFGTFFSNILYIKSKQ